MDYEKKYKQLYTLISDLYPFMSEYCKEKIEGFFSEFKESEDERIRKAIHIYLDWLDGKKEYAPKGEYSIRDMIAWLEKQGEQKLTNIEPKFKVGDWVVYETEEWREVLQIKTIEIERYTFTDGSSSSFTEEQYMHLWTIDDARDGDVLASKNGCPFIYKKSDSVEARFYCCVDFENYFCVCDGTSHCGFKDSSKPATKEQRDLLFQKMKEAGYMWDAEKKELKKIEQNPTWSEEDEEKLDLTISLLKEFREVFQKDAESCIEWLKSLKPQPHWKPTEEQMSMLLAVLNDSNNITAESVCIALKSLYNDLKKL